MTDPIFHINNDTDVPTWHLLLYFLYLPNFKFKLKRAGSGSQWWYSIQKSDSTGLSTSMNMVDTPYISSTGVLNAMFKSFAVHSGFMGDNDSQCSN
jgi:hypothetical protein